MKRAEAWAIAEGLGYELNDVREVRLQPSQIEVEVMLRNEDGKFYTVVDPETHERDAARRVDTIPYEREGKG